MAVRALAAPPEEVLAELIAELGPGFEPRPPVAARDPEVQLAMLVTALAIPLPVLPRRSAPPVAEAAPEPVAEAAPEPVAEAAPEPPMVAAPEAAAEIELEPWPEAEAEDVAAPPDAEAPPEFDAAPEAPAPRVDALAELEAEIDLSALPSVDTLDPPLILADRPSEGPPAIPVDDLDILEADDSFADGDPSLDAAPSPPALLRHGPEESLGDLDASAGENTVDRELKAFFAEGGAEPPPPAPDAALLRPTEAAEAPSGPRARRDNSLLTNVKKLFRK